MAQWRRRTMEARMALLLEVQRIEGEGHSQRQAILAIVEAARAGKLRPELQALVADANARGGKSGSRSLSRTTMYEWMASFAERGRPGLAPADVEPAPPPPWRDAFHRAWGRPSRPKLAEAVRAMEAGLPPGIAMPSYHTVHAYWSKLTPLEREAGRSGPNAMLALRPYKHRSVEGLEPMATVTADGHTFKAWVENPRSRRPFNPEVAVVMDTATRYILGFSTGLAESSEVIRDAIRRTVEQFGLFAMFYTDNGSGFIAKAMTSETVGLLARISATAVNSTPGRAQARGKIEAFMKVLRAAARELVTYTGRDMDREFKKRLEKQIATQIRATGTSRQVKSWEDFTAFLNGVIDHYNNHPHRGLPKFVDATGKRRHMSPAEAMANWRAKGWAPKMAPASTLEDLFRPYVERVSRRGLVSLGDGEYFADALAPLHGSKVRVGYDQNDNSRVWIRTLEDDRFVCVAHLNAHHTPQFPRTMVQIAQDKRNDRQIQLLREKAEGIEAERQGFRVIEQAPQVAPHWLNPTIDQAHAELVSQAAVPLPAYQVTETNEDRWWRRATRLLAALAEGETLSDTDARWLDVNRQEAWFQARLVAASHGALSPTTDPTRKTA
jgi:putative transposase